MQGDRTVNKKSLHFPRAESPGRGRPVSDAKEK